MSSKPKKKKERAENRLGDSESEASWTSLFTWLKRRGLQGVDLVVSDDHGGLVKAVRVQFQGATWQRCQTHLARNVLDATPRRCMTHCMHESGRSLRPPTWRRPARCWTNW